MRGDKIMRTRLPIIVSVQGLPSIASGLLTIIPVGLSHFYYYKELYLAGSMG